jgi:hypothetical protein
LSEAWDVIQATKTLIYVMCKDQLDGGSMGIQLSNLAHCEKLEERAENGLIDLRGEWIIRTTEVSSNDKTHHT